MKRWIIQKLAAALCVPVKFELLPIAEGEFSELERTYLGFPCFYSRAKFEDAVWPRPGHKFRVYVEID
jgi:hypothetical protein